MKKLKPLSFLALGAGAVLSSAAHAQATVYPYYLGAAQTVSYDSYMQRYGGTGADWISSTGVRAGIDQAFGRQQVVADFSANRNIFRRNGVLNNNDYALNARLNWSTIERISGVLGIQSSESLYKNTLTTQTLGRNLLRSNGVSLQANVGLVTVWSFDAGVATNRQRTSNPDPSFSFLNLDQTTWSAGVRWSPTPDLMVRLGARQTDGRLPSIATTGGGTGTDFKRDDIDLSTNVALSGVSRVNVRLSSTRVNYDTPGFTDQRGWTGLAGWDWQPTGKLKFSLSASRDSLFGSVDQSGALISSSSNSNRLSNTLALNTNWEVTSKLLANSRLSYMRRTFDSTSSALLGGVALPATTATGKDSIAALTLGLRYNALRNLSLGCGISVEDHRVSGNPAAVPIQEYNARTYNCYGQAFLR